MTVVEMLLIPILFWIVSRQEKMLSNLNSVEKIILLMEEKIDADRHTW